MTNEEAFKQLVKFKNSLLMELRNVSYHPTLDNESPIEFIYIALQALEKQIPKEPLNENNWHYYCPQCKKEITVLFFNVEKMSHEQKPSNFCANCGQAIEGVTHDTQA